MSKKTVSVVGAGVAGLASAIRLQHAGYQVTIFEKEARVGGKMNCIEMDGYRFDLGPTIVMMPDIYREIFEMTGRDPEDYIPMIKLEEMYSAFFGPNNNEEMSFSSDLTKTINTFEAVDPKDAKGFLDYLQTLYGRFQIAKDYFLQRGFRKASDFYNPNMLLQTLRLKTFNSADSIINHFITNPRLRQVLSFQTLYIGISPKTGPSLYTIIPMIEWLYGVWFIKGGMYAMASGMERLFLELGGQICCQKTVEEVLIADQVAKGIKLADQTVIQSDFVIVNADFPYAMKHLVTDKKAKGKYTDDKIDQMSYSCSCFVLYLGLNRKYDQVKNVHNFVFSNDLDDNISAIFEGKLLEDPSFYVYMASKLDPSLAPSDKDGVYLLTPVPDLETAQYDWTDKTTTYYRQKLVDGLKKVPGFETVEEDIVCETAMTPPDFLKRFNAYRGACFGLQPTLTQSNHLRPQSKAKNCERLYFTGSSTHPGAGVPIVLLSAKIAVDELLSDDLGIEPQPLSI